ncbi:MAG: DEAD/DEAH box helicase [Planctomycetia bacterium]|nr:DEAD/DEAH box helicase [Planctomycetia bacterium]
MESEALPPDATDLPTSFPESDDAEAATPLRESEPPLPPEIVTRSEDAPKIAYADFKLIRPLFDAVEKAGYKFATPVQGAVIPPAMRGQDVIGQAQTGTGKTAAFLIPFLNRWRPHKLKGPIGLVMCPTRELAVQVANEAIKLATSSRFHVVPVYGGARMGSQLAALAKGCDLVVGTPGRIIDHLRRGSLSLDNVKYVVLDEADRMLDIGFRPDIERILRRCPEQRQTLLMSATVPDSIKKLVHRYMRNPIHLNMSPSVLTVDKIQQKYITVDEDKKFDLLKLVVEREKPRQCLIFVERKRWADRLYRNLKHVVPGVAVIHGDLPQSQREKITAAFRAGKVKYLIATDVMSRGIDVEGISHVVNYDLPMDIENYVHRIGRTGRIGRDGVAISFVTPEQGGHLTDIEMIINKLIDKDEIPGFESYTRRERPDDRVRVISVDGAPADDTVIEEPPAAAKKTVYGKPGRRYSQRL